MRRWSFIPGMCLILLALSACNPQNPQPGSTQSPLTPVLGWSKVPGDVVFRLDRMLSGGTVYQNANMIPPCTLYGDGLVVWTNPRPPNGDEVQEAQISDTTFRSFLEFIIRDQKFYEIPDYASQEAPPTGPTLVESISLKLNGEVHTVRNYISWPKNVYNVLLQRCTTLNTDPTSVKPGGAWVTAYAVPREPSTSSVPWSGSWPFSLEKLAASKDRVWATGNVLNVLWRTIRQSGGSDLWLENNKTYQVAIEVPGISRDAPPAPPMTPTPTFVPQK